MGDRFCSRGTWRLGGLAALCILAQCQALAAGGSSPGGTVEGVVTIATAPSRRLASPGAYPGRSVSVGPSGAGSELANVIVFVDLRTPAPVEPTHTAIRQVDEVFVPRLVAVTTGSTVEFPNEDFVFHNVFSLSRAATFDLGRYRRGESRSRRFDKPGVVKVFCHLHSHMSALVRVFDHRHFARPDAHGRFTLDGVPAGRHRVVAWHERVGEVALNAVVSDGGRTSLSFVLPVADPP